MGAAALAWVPRGFPVLVHVREGWRRGGVGRALVEAAMDAAAGETRFVRAWSPVEQDSAPARFLAACGFTVFKRLLTFETDGVAFETAMGALLRRARARVPADASLVTLAEAPAQEVVRLVAPQFDALPHDVAWRLRPGVAGGYDPALSLVLMHAGRVAGAILCRRFGDSIEVDANVVAPAYRRGWANLLLVEGITRRARAAGLATCRFCCEEHVTNTLNLGRRTQARFLAPKLLMMRALKPPVWAYSAAA